MAPICSIGCKQHHDRGDGDIFERVEFIPANPLPTKHCLTILTDILIRQSTHSILYRIEGDRIFVLALAHWSQRPGYWEQRAD